GPNGARSPVSGTMSPTVSVLLLLLPQPAATPAVSAASVSALVTRTNLPRLTSFSSPSISSGNPEEPGSQRPAYTQRPSRGNPAGGWRANRRDAGENDVAAG